MEEKGRNRDAKGGKGGKLASLKPGGPSAGPEKEKGGEEKVGPKGGGKKADFGDLLEEPKKSGRRTTGKKEN